MRGSGVGSGARLNTMQGEGNMAWLTQLLTAFSKPFKWWIVIAPWERGLRVRLGKTATTLIPGPHWRIPFLDRVYVQSIRLRTIMETNQTLSTKDGKVVTLSFAVRFIINDVAKLYQSVYNPETTMGTIVMSSVAQHVGETMACDLTALQIEQAVNANLDEVRGWGIGEVGFSVTGFAFTRTYRILNSDYRVGAGLYDLDENPRER